MSDWKDICQAIPGIENRDVELTSPATPNYNCIAWAASDQTNWWWPDGMGIYYWPDEAPREVTVDAFIAAYATRGYEVCNDSNQESGFEKVAIFCKHGIPTHAARQLPSGKWTSKLGQLGDVGHGPSDVDNPTYGKPTVFLKRPLGDEV